MLKRKINIKFLLAFLKTLANKIVRTVGGRLIDCVSHEFFLSNAWKILNTIFRRISMHIPIGNYYRIYLLNMFCAPKRLPKTVETIRTESALFLFKTYKKDFHLMTLSL
jgi:hypothetical protein